MLALKSGDEDRRDMIISLNPQSRLPFPWVNGQLKIGLEAVSAEMRNSGLTCLSSAEVSKGFVSAVEPLAGDQDPKQKGADYAGNSVPWWQDLSCLGPIFSLVQHCSAGQLISTFRTGPRFGKLRWGKLSAIACMMLASLNLVAHT